MSGQVHALILAAGASRRLGQPKPLVRLPGGQTLLEQAIATVREAGLAAMVTVRAGDSAVDKEARRLGAQVIEVEEADEGMAASIRAGALHSNRDAAVAGVLIVLVDQWRLTAGDLTALVTTWREAGAENLVAARYAGAAGVPAVFGRAFFDRLMELRGDRGARDLLRSGDVPVVAIELPCAATDLDTPEEQVIASGSPPK